MSRASMSKKGREVAAMFDTVGKKYDLTNTLLSFGMDAYWRVATRKRLGLRPGMKVLDVAAGTAVSTVELGKSGAWVVALDFSLGMLKAGKKRQVPKVAGDCLHLPFPDNTFDAVTISYGLRNVEDFRAGLREMARVTKPGGQITVAEFSTPIIPGFRELYRFYLTKILPAVARKVSSNPESYEYLAESISKWPAQEEVAEAMAESGWTECGWQNLNFGIVALHSGIKP
ncbi:MAG: demethylmenaquinone methyltransferase [Corynebacterium sp.]|nr:demethylmenaquinone methyltransferase [Corynebacterium sp.]